MIGQIIVWLIVGALAGTLVGMLVTWSKRGFGVFANLGIGMAGALIGGGIFRLFNIDLGLGQIAITFEDLIAASLGSLILVIVIWIIRSRKKAKST
jgi:uncharacterized membrane protein YeaQ/YmgE (transglycosylase-associated protein family)